MRSRTSFAGRARWLVAAALGTLAAAHSLAPMRAQQPAERQPPGPPDEVVVRAIAAPSTPLPSEAASADVRRFSFIAYGDTRSAGPAQPGEHAPDGRELQREHGRVVDAMLDSVRSLADTPFPVRFVVNSGDAVLYGPDAGMWNVSFVPLVERLTRQADLPYFFAVGNHDATSRLLGDPEREHGIRNTLSAMAQLMPAEGTPRRLSGYPTYAFGYGNSFFVLLDSTIATDPTQRAWVARQLEGLDVTRYHHVFAVFHHPPFSSGPHGGPTLAPESAAIRDLYLPLFRQHHVRMTICGHDHLLDHWIERYDDSGVTRRMDHLVSGGGGAPTYVFSGEPDLQPYLTANAAQNVRLEHLARPGARVEENVHHFVVVQVDGDRLSLQVIGTGATPFLPYGRERLELADRVQ
jgi:hypothetical protein